MSNKKMTIEEIIEKMHSIKAEDLKELPSGGFICGEIPTEECCECEGELCEMEETYVEVPLSRYDELVAKSTAMDILSSTMKRSGKVDGDIVWAVTGAIPEPQIKELTEKADTYWGYYSKEKDKVEKLEQKVAELQKYIDTLMPPEEAEEVPEEGGNG